KILGRVGLRTHASAKAICVWGARCAGGHRHVNEGCTLSIDIIRGAIRGGQMRGGRAAIAAVMAALSLPVGQSAAEENARARALPAPAYDWTITLGAEGREEPLFQGSSRERLRPYPIFAVRRYGTPEPFRGPRDGLDIAVIDGGNYQIGPVGQF